MFKLQLVLLLFSPICVMCLVPWVPCGETPVTGFVRGLADGGAYELFNSPNCGGSYGAPAEFCAAGFRVVVGNVTRACLEPAAKAGQTYRMEVDLHESACRVDEEPPRPPTLPRPEPCRQPPRASGACPALTRRWSYVPHTGTCVEFAYGCEGNANRFSSREACLGICARKTVEPPPQSRVCRQEPGVIGPCRAAMPRWTYKQETFMCERFHYGGCRGNDNRFRSRIECRNVCGPKAMYTPRAARRDAMIMPERRCGPLPGGRRFTCSISATESAIQVPYGAGGYAGGPPPAGAGNYWSYYKVPLKCTMAGETVQRNGYWKGKVLGQLERAEQMIRDKL